MCVCGAWGGCGCVCGCVCVCVCVYIDNRDYVTRIGIAITPWLWRALCREFLAVYTNGVTKGFVLGFFSKSEWSFLYRSESAVT